MLDYQQFADSYHRKNGSPTSEAGNIRLAIRSLPELFGHMMARDFSPLHLKTVRESLIRGDLCRNEINRRVRLMVRAFKWAVSEGLVPPSVHHGLKSVDGLKKGRCAARESRPVRSVADAYVDAVRPFVSRQTWAMIELQRLTGMRPGEVCIMRTCDITMGGPIWEYRPASHKTEHHDKERVIYIGPCAQSILGCWLKTDLAAYLFSPREAVDERRAELRIARRTKVQPSQQHRRKPSPKQRPGERYNTRSYGHAIANACDRAFPHPSLTGILESQLTEAQRSELRAWRKDHRWHPNQLRHNAATRIRREHGLDAARAILGHTTPVITEIYATLDAGKAAEVMSRIG